MKRSNFRRARKRQKINSIIPGNPVNIAVEKMLYDGRNFFRDDLVFYNAIASCFPDELKDSMRSEIVEQLEKSNPEFLEKIEDDLISVLFSNYSKYERYEINDMSRYVDFKSICGQYIEEFISANRDYCTIFSDKASFFKERFNLSRKETRLLEVLFTYTQIDEVYGDLFDQYFNGVKAFLDFISISANLSIIETRRLMSSNSNINKYGLIEKLEITYNSIEVSIPDLIEDFVSDVYTEDDLISNCYTVFDDSVFNIDSYVIPPENKSIMVELLRNTNDSALLFYGKPGTGKTELAKTIVKEAGKNCYFLKTDEFSRMESYKSRINLAMSFLSNDDVLIIDEADDLLNNSGVSMFERNKNDLSKVDINNLLDSHKIKTIWITNYYGRIDESTLRRFSYSLKFQEFNKQQRVGIWKTIIKKYNVKYLNTKEMIHFAETYSLSTGSIDYAVKNALAISKNKNEFTKFLDEFLNNHNILIHNRDNSDKVLNSINKTYSLKYINADYDLSSIVETCSVIKDKLENKEEVSAKIMMHGLPGTGKTEFAKYLADKLDMDLHYKRYSDLQSKYVGEGEKNIANAFADAAENNAILFIDEADSFFKDRTASNRNWEITQTNELLTQLENFNGIFICATNLLSLIDGAAMRRFNFKIKFNSLNKEMICDVFKSYFSSYNGRLTQSLKIRLLNINELTFGDIKAVSEKIKFVSKEKVNYDSIITDLENEANYKNKSISKKVGF